MEYSTADSINLPSRSLEYTRLIEELKECIVSTTAAAQRLYEQGKKDGLSNEVIRKDIELALGGIVKERRLREILPPQLKHVSKVRKPVLRHLSAANTENKITTAELNEQEESIKTEYGIFQIKPEEYRTEDLPKYDREQLIKIIKWYEERLWKFDLSPISFTYKDDRWDFGRNIFKLRYDDGEWEWDVDYHIEKIPVVVDKNKISFDIDGFKKEINKILQNE